MRLALKRLISGDASPNRMQDAVFHHSRHAAVAVRRAVATSRALPLRYRGREFLTGGLLAAAPWVLLPLAAGAGAVCTVTCW